MRHFRLYIELDWATMHCPCGVSCRTDSGDYEGWKVRHRLHTDDGGKQYLEENDPTAWAKCFAGSCPEPVLRSGLP